MTHHNAQQAVLGAESMHRHRFAFPSPVAGNRWIVGTCACGAESRGRAFESNEYEEARSFRRRKA